MFDIDLTQHLAKLSRLKFSDAELKTMTEQMVRIVELMDTIGGFDIEGDAARRPAVDYAALRRDVEQPSFPRDEILKNAAEKSDTCFKVPKVV